VVNAPQSIYSRFEHIVAHCRRYVTSSLRLRYNG
jgi:hypothetical protein